MSDETKKSGEAVQLAALAEPICIVAKSDAGSIAAAAVLMAALSRQDRRCCVQIMQQYNSAELEGLMHEDYPSFLILGCNEQEYLKKFSGMDAVFITAPEAYEAACALSKKSKSAAFILVAGLLGDYLEQGGRLVIPEAALQDALQGHQLVSRQDFDMADLDEHFLLSLSVRNDPIFRKLPDLAEMINACARLGQGQLVVGTLLGDRHSRDGAVKNWVVFKRDMSELLAWYERNKGKQVSLGNGYIIVHMRDYVAPHLAGSLAAHLARKSNLDENTFVLVLVHLPDSKLRVSLRVAGQREQTDVAKIMQKIFEGVAGEFGGNISAAGGVLSRSDEERFLMQAQKTLEKAFVEEFVDKEKP